MPAARDYTCKSCHLEFERFQDTFEESPACPACGEASVWVPSFYYSRPKVAQTFSPVVIHRAEDGSIRYPGSANAPVPAGFQKVELTTLSQVRQFEAEVNRAAAPEIEKFDYNRRRNVDEQIRMNREGLAARLEEFTPRGRVFYERMKEAAGAKRERTASRAPQGAGFHLEAFSQNSSNRESYRDAGNDWGRSGSRK